MIHATQLHGQASGREQEYLAGWQRARAEFNNFRRRIQEDNSADRTRLQTEMLETLLPLADNFKAMADHLPKELEGNPWAEGVGHIARQFDQLLVDYGLTPINDVGQPFDPQKHEATATITKRGAATGQIVEIIQTGYLLKSKVIRPAKVKVAA